MKGSEDTKPKIEVESPSIENFQKKLQAQGQEITQTLIRHELEILQQPKDRPDRSLELKNKHREEIEKLIGKHAQENLYYAALLSSKPSVPSVPASITPQSPTANAVLTIIRDSTLLSFVSANREELQKMMECVSTIFPSFYSAIGYACEKFSSGGSSFPDGSSFCVIEILKKQEKQGYLIQGLFPSSLKDEKDRVRYNAKDENTLLAPLKHAIYNSILFCDYHAYTLLIVSIFTHGERQKYCVAILTRDGKLFPASIVLGTGSYDSYIISAYGCCSVLRDTSQFDPSPSRGSTATLVHSINGHFGLAREDGELGLILRGLFTPSDNSGKVNCKSNNTFLEGVVDVATYHDINRHISQSLRRYDTRSLQHKLGLEVYTSNMDLESLSTMTPGKSQRLPQMLPSSNASIVHLGQYCLINKKEKCMHLLLSISHVSFCLFF